MVLGLGEDGSSDTERSKRAGNGRVEGGLRSTQPTPLRFKRHTRRELGESGAQRGARRGVRGDAPGL